MQVRGVSLVAGTFGLHYIGSGFMVGALQGTCCDDVKRGQPSPCVCRDTCCRDSKEAGAHEAEIVAGTVHKNSACDVTLKIQVPMRHDAQINTS